MRDSESSNLTDNDFATTEGCASADRDGQPTTPWWAWLLLAAAVVAVSSAATAFRSMEEVPPMTLAAWRLQLTGILLFPGAVIQYRNLAPVLQDEARKSGLLMLTSGLSLAFHFALWVWGIDHTSLTHALLYVSITPILIAAGMWAMGKPLSQGENIGTGIGAFGGLLLAFSGVKEGQVTLMGDSACVIASLAVIAYLSIGRRLRAWMPLFVYAFPVTGSAAGFLTLAAISFGGASVSSSGRSGVAGWITSKYLAGVVYLAVIPGILGHTSFNALLKYLHPLAIALPLTLEPVIGSLIGYFLGVSSPPYVLTYVGGGVLLTAVAIVTVAGYKRESEERGRS